MSPACRCGDTCSSTVSTTCAGTITHTMRGTARRAMKSACESAPSAPLPTMDATLAGAESNTTQRCPPLSSRCTMLPPMRPRPIIPNCMLSSPVSIHRWTRGALGRYCRATRGHTGHLTMIVVVIGVAGSGKSTIGAPLARAIAGQFLEGDTLHPPANIEQMSRGIPLDDDDRRPWLADIHAHIAGASRRGVSLVVACSALKQSYRDFLERGVVINWVYLKGSKELLLRRLQARSTHFMKAGMLDSQLNALEEPSNASVIDAAKPPDAI